MSVLRGARAGEGVPDQAMLCGEKLNNQQIKNFKNKGLDLEGRLLQKDICGLYTSKWHNLDEMDKILGTHNVLRQS